MALQCASVGRCCGIQRRTIGNCNAHRFGSSGCIIGGRTCNNVLVQCDSGSVLTAEGIFEQYQRCSVEHDSLPLSLKDSQSGRGLFANTNFKKGEILLEIPSSLCILVDYRNGVQLPPGDWPRLCKAVEQDDSLPWDIVQSLALLDAMSGSGSEHLQKYTNYVLPDALHMSLPFCLPEHMLVELQDDGVIQKAMEQKERLRSLFPGLAAPMIEDGPSWLQYAFACVRSRAFRLGKDIYGFVPILDIANHSFEPNADFTLSDDGEKIYFFAFDDIQKNDEVCISYSGKIGYTNERMMLQYGFVFGNGNPFDRYAMVEGMVPSGLKDTTLGLDAVQLALGDGDAMVNTMSGKDPYSYAALKSLPIAEEGSSKADQLRLVQHMLERVESSISDWSTSLHEDESVLGHMVRSPSADTRIQSVINYRIQRKRLSLAMKELLGLIRTYLRTHSYT